MPTDEPGSVTRWISDLKAGGGAAAQHLWERDFERLVHLARNRLRAARGPSAAEDEENAALSVFDSFCRGAAAGRFPCLTDRDDLWRLLVVLTLRKAVDLIDRQAAAWRGGRRRGGQSALAPDRANRPGGSDLDGLVGRSRRPSSPRWWPNSTSGCAAPWGTTRSARSSTSGWRGMIGKRSRRGWAAPCGRSPGNSM